jgi:hypothetical protein
MLEQDNFNAEFYPMLEELVDVGFLLVIEDPQGLRTLVLSDAAKDILNSILTGRPVDTDKYDQALIDECIETFICDPTSTEEAVN